jgi:hypothetical protein
LLVTPTNIVVEPLGAVPIPSFAVPLGMGYIVVPARVSSVVQSKGVVRPKQIAVIQMEIVITVMQMEIVVVCNGQKRNRGMLKSLEQ